MQVNVFVWTGVVLMIIKDPPAGRNMNAFLWHDVLSHWFALTWQAADNAHIIYKIIQVLYYYHK